MKKFYSYFAAIAIAASAPAAYAQGVAYENMPGTWSSVGEATLVDGWICPALGIDQTKPENQWKVELLKNDQNENYYALLDPYKSGPVASTNTFYEEKEFDDNIEEEAGEKHGFIVFDISDPDHVVFNRIDNTSLGQGKMPILAGYENLAINLSEVLCNNALGTISMQLGEPSYAVSVIESVGLGFPFTTFKDGVVTLKSLDSPVDWGEFIVQSDACYSTVSDASNYLVWEGKNMFAQIIFPEQPGDEEGENPEIEYPEISSLAGDYTFSSTMTKTDAFPAAYSGVLNSTFSFSLSYNEAAGNLTSTNFLANGVLSIVDYDQETGVLTYKQVYIKPVNPALYIAPSDGGYTGFNADVANYLKFQVKPDGTLTLADFSLGTATNLAGDGFTDVVAYSNISIARKYAPEEKSWEGTYTISGTTFDYTEDPAAPAVEIGDLTLVINNAGQLVSLNNNLIDFEMTDEQIENGFNTGSENANGYSLSFGARTGYDFYFQTAGENNYTCGYYLSGRSIVAYSQEGRLALTANEDESFDLSTFTIWHRTVKSIEQDGKTEYVSVYEIAYRWVQGDATDEVSFAGSYPLTGTFVNYSDDAESKSSGDFTLEINYANQIVSIANYTLDQFDIADGRNAAIANGNELVLTAGLNTGLTWEATMLLLGGESTENYSVGDRITFTKNSDSSYSLSPFTIWRRTVDDKMNIDYTLVSYWDDTLYESGVENIAVDPEAPAEFFNLQGVRVANPENGVYIRRQGENISKVLVK